MPRRKILCFASYYLPGSKSGGPVRSLSNMCEWLRDEYDFCIVTRNRDLGDAAAYEDRVAGRQYAIDGATVSYLNKPYWSPTPLLRAVAEAKPDLLYFQSFLDPAITITPLVLRRLGRIPAQIPVVVAPRGEFSPGALSLKRRKKASYLYFAKRVGLYTGVTWHATGDDEAAHIRDWCGPDANIACAPNLPTKAFLDHPPERSPKVTGTLRLMWLSRVSPKKNLLGALAVLRMVEKPVAFDIYGTQEDPAYWEKCRLQMNKLPSNVRVSYKGYVPAERVVQTLSQYDAFFLPTLGENFGHVILEALLAGCPILLSDQTPWRNLAARRAGFDLPLDQPHQFRLAIERLAAMDDAEFSEWSKNARDYGKQYCLDRDLVEPTRRMLESAMTKRVANSG